jgi:exopolysaccharide production protein ExoY
MDRQLGDHGPAPADLSAAGKDPALKLNAPMKRLFDIVGALGLLVLASPLLLVIFLMIRVHDNHPALFSQERVGLGGRMFRCFKVRSMVPDATALLPGILASNPAARTEWDRWQKLTHDPRVTPLGQFIRKTSIDELPQLWNVLKGDMSLVGPRPISYAETVRYGDAIADYASVRPGLTGLWQVSGRSDIEYDERVKLDSLYANGRSFWGDIRILLMTIPAVMKSRGAR